jgi:four helix bundle protein
LAAWQRCHELAVAVYKATSGFPSAERYGLVSQARRAAFSAAANIAEGAAKRGPNEFRRYLDISIGSLAELSYTLLLARELSLLTQTDFEVLERIRHRAGFLTWRLYRAVSRKRTE